MVIPCGTFKVLRIMVDTDNAKSKPEFKKPSKYMGGKLDKESRRFVFKQLFQ